MLKAPCLRGGAINGDFNLKQIDWANNTVRGIQGSYQNKIFDCINDLFLSEIIKEPTRLRGTDTPSNLDWVLTEKMECVQDKNICSPLGLSDHSLISVSYQCVTEKDESDNSNQYSFFKGNYQDMREDFRNIEWDKELKNSNTQQAWDIIHNKLTGLIERHVPKKKFTHSKKPPWYGRQIGTLSNKKRKAWHKYHKNPSSENWQNYTCHRNKLTYTIEKLKIDYENKIAAESKQNPKVFWKYINRKSKHKSKIAVLNDDNNVDAIEDFDKAELLNNKFASNFTKENTDTIPDFDPNFENLIIMETIDVKSEDIKKLLLNLDPSKSSGPDGINGRILKELANELSPVLEIMYTKSIEEGHLPYQWK